MAPAAHRFATASAAIVLFTAVLRLCAAVDLSPVILRPPLGGGDSRHTMFLPLFPSHRNFSSVSAAATWRTRRHLHGSDAAASRRPNAVMGLHDSLLHGYYTTRLYIGTPSQKFALIVDTGSTVTYVPCSTCEQCGRHQDPNFQPDESSSYKQVKCNIDCTCDNNNENCIYERQYAEMSSSSGVLGEDIISFGNESELTPQRAIFGCENSETGDLHSQRADGIMGLGRGELSIVDQLVDSGVISDSFSLCYGGMGIGGGAMILGAISPPSDMVYTHSDPSRSPYYNIELKEIHVAGKKLSLNPRVFDGKHGTVLDSGTTYAYLPEAAFIAFKDAILKELHLLQQIPGPDPSYNDICFTGAGSDVLQLSKTFPVVEMVFGNKQKIALSPENYLFKHSKVHGAYCLGVFQNGKDPTTLLGGIIVRNTLVTYDREHEKVGFWKTNCSELWERLGTIGAPPPPMPSNDERENSTAELSPTLAPPAPQQYNFSGEIKVGRIAFFMSLNISYADLKPHMSDLTRSIAHEFDVNTSQVQMLNFSAKGNDSLIRWAIVPAGSSEYFPNATAMGILARLAERRVKLPDLYGSYKLFEWEIVPPTKQTWWQQHYMAVVVGILVTFVLGLSASGAWIIWRRRQETQIPYKPVDSAVPEQELQPLEK